MTRQKIIKASAKEKILDATFSVVRAKGYEATTVDDLCEAAGVIKSVLFRHFASKEGLGVAAANHWSNDRHVESPGKKSIPMSGDEHLYQHGEDDG